ncbi:MAG: 2-C-methyl-D-erythritol 2,4-cyclodiphosphate synthase [Ignavibacteriae bacterium HGW-Ignavibacteriae-1]|jgi:2-C-methyl-D-erythritol 2,4-cyclodiphosphate synthase|nr:MAG: 2-C-methyl-D-erythritol 2,4-cyclodiphosphate synthase [Ignavibacteriae bacterium HGW-Ignavibacteriae-1]
MKVGFGYDVHKLAPNESFILGGIQIESEIGTVAHSDGDVLAHAIIDAILGAAGLGDIGDHFPDTDMKYKDCNSMELLAKCVELIRKNNYAIGNIDATINLEKPKLYTYKEAMKNSIAKVCEIEPTNVNIKATTNEKMGFVGRNEGIAVYCVCLITEQN